MTAENEQTEKISRDQQRARFALEKVKKLEEKDVGNYVSYVKGMPSNIVTNGLGQTLAFERASQVKDPGHKHLYKHLNGWLCHGEFGIWKKSDDDSLEMITRSPETTYIKAQAEALAFLRWLKKFARAYLSAGDDR